MDFLQLSQKRRTIRRFENKPISQSDLYEIVDCARIAPSASNLQPLKYIIVNAENMLDKVFDCTAWAGYLKGEGTPKEGECPKAYVVILADKTIRSNGNELDAGAAAMSIIFAALDKGIGSCWIGSVNRERLTGLLGISDIYEIISVIALGYPAEQPVMEDLINGDIKYYKDEKNVLHVPKRALMDVIVRSWN